MTGWRDVAAHREYLRRPLVPEFIGQAGLWFDGQTGPSLLFDVKGLRTLARPIEYPERSLRCR